MQIRAKKHLGQHFLNDDSIACRIVDSLTGKSQDVLEIGPGTGVLTRHLIQNEKINLYMVEVDREAVDYLQINIPDIGKKILYGDFLKMDMQKYFSGDFSIIGNFPYNISSQIFFRVLEMRNRIPEVVGMLQKEVAERLAAPPGSKIYGILSVLLQAYYDIEYLFTVDENVFTPPPKVKSAVVRLTRNSVQQLDCDEVLFKTIVKTAFNQRRKTLRNALKSIAPSPELMNDKMFDLRAERLSVNDFVNLTKLFTV